MITKTKFRSIRYCMCYGRLCAHGDAIKSYETPQSDCELSTERLRQVFFSFLPNSLLCNFRIGNTCCSCLPSTYFIRKLVGGYYNKTFATNYILGAHCLICSGVQLVNKLKAI